MLTGVAPRYGRDRVERGEEASRSPERARAEEFFEKAGYNLADADGVELGASEELGSLGWAQVHLLKAIYHDRRS